MIELLDHCACTVLLIIRGNHGAIAPTLSGKTLLEGGS